MSHSTNISVFGQETFFNEKATFFKGIKVFGEVETPDGSLFGQVQLQYLGKNIGGPSKIINFKGGGVTSIVHEENIKKSTITIKIPANIDGGVPDSNYGGIMAIDGGGVI
jgi:hypothetical protein